MCIIFVLNISLVQIHNFIMIFSVQTVIQVVGIQPVRQTVNCFVNRQCAAMEAHNETLFFKRYCNLLVKLKKKFKLFFKKVKLLRKNTDENL